MKRVTVECQVWVGWSSWDMASVTMNGVTSPARTISSFRLNVPSKVMKRLVAKYGDCPKDWKIEVAK